jgi:hypothetical protein
MPCRRHTGLLAEITIHPVLVALRSGVRLLDHLETETSSAGSCHPRPG